MRLNRLPAAGVAALAPGSLLAQPFEFASLHRPDLVRSHVYSAGENQQVGWGTLGDTFRNPLLWSGIAASMVDLLPPGGFWEQGDATGTSQGRQVGWLGSVTGLRHAALWSGSAESFVDIHPAGFRSSEAHAVRRAMAVGFANTNINFDRQAGWWDLGTGSYTYLHPRGARYSVADATDGRSQGGAYAIGFGGLRACLWHGTSASFTNLHPGWAVESAVRGMGIDSQGRQVQVGEVINNATRDMHAAVWFGSVESYASLNPPGCRDAIIYATTGDIHVGTFIPRRGQSGWTPIVWFGNDPARFINLAPYLGPDFFGGGATGVSVVGDTLSITG